MVGRVPSTTEQNKRRIRLFVEAVWNDGRLELIDELVGDDYVGLGPGERILGREGVRRLVASRRSGHPGLHIRIVDQIAEDDRVATSWQASGAPGGPRCCAGISIVRLLAGMQVDSHTQLSHDGGRT